MKREMKREIESEKGNKKRGPSSDNCNICDRSRERQRKIEISRRKIKILSDSGHVRKYMASKVMNKVSKLRRLQVVCCLPVKEVSKMNGNKKLIKSQVS